MRQIVFEALIALMLGIFGASLDAPELKEITWASEMKQRYLHYMVPHDVADLLF
jgi:hypothetical protein